ncbi:hypothetical protein [Labrys okinawensis]|nr:hypothetical protein [Labrys okinawensis]
MFFSKEKFIIWVGIAVTVLWYSLCVWFCFALCYYVTDKGDLFFAIEKVVFLLIAILFIGVLMWRFGNIFIFKSKYIEVKLALVFQSCSAGLMLLIFNLKKPIAFEGAITLYILAFFVGAFGWFLSQVVAARFVKRVIG